MTCDRCDDTGSLSKDIDGFLDCPFCDASGERAELEKWVLTQGIAGGGLASAWVIYQHGKTAALNT